MTRHDTLPALLTEYQRLEARLSEQLPESERAEVKSAIVALFRRSETAIAELEAFKESIRHLVDRFKALPTPAAEAPAHPPNSRR